MTTLAVNPPRTYPEITIAMLQTAVRERILSDQVSFKAFVELLTKRYPGLALNTTEVETALRTGQGVLSQILFAIVGQAILQSQLNDSAFSIASNVNVNPAEVQPSTHHYAEPAKKPVIPSTTVLSGKSLFQQLASAIDEITDSTLTQAQRLLAAIQAKQSELLNFAAKATRGLATLLSKIAPGHAVPVNDLLKGAVSVYQRNPASFEQSSSAVASAPASMLDKVNPFKRTPNKVNYTQTWQLEIERLLKSDPKFATLLNHSKNPQLLTFLLNSSKKIHALEQKLIELSDEYNALVKPAVVRGAHQLQPHIPQLLADLNLPRQSVPGAANSSDAANSSGLGFMGHLSRGLGLERFFGAASAPSVSSPASGHTPALPSAPSLVQ